MDRRQPLVEAKADAITAEMREEYLQPHAMPWVIATSWGKDSTMLGHLAFRMLVDLPPSERGRPVHFVTNDTLVESPLVAIHAARRQAEVAGAAEAFGLPVTVATTRPRTGRTFWVNLVGRGYAMPSRRFRWCTDRLKIEPTADYVAGQVDAAGGVILLIGVRRAESASRAASVARHDNGERLNPHGTMRGCSVFRPIVELGTDEVWEFLITNPPPWRSSHRELVTLYRDAGGGECLAVTSKDDAPSCGTASPRMGCWVCSLVSKDRSLGGFVASGHAEFEPLLDFRDWLVSIRDDPARRQALRRDGRPRFRDDGRLVPGPFTLQARMEILDRLDDLARRTGMKIVSPGERSAIKDAWAADALAVAGRLSERRIG